MTEMPPNDYLRSPIGVAVSPDGRHGRAAGAWPVSATKAPRAAPAQNACAVTTATATLSSPWTVVFGRCRSLPAPVARARATIETDQTP